MSPDLSTAKNREPATRRSQNPTRVAGVLLVVGAVQFVLGMAITQLAWTTNYGLLDNYISDLGAVGCGDFPSGSSHYVCSPWHLVFDSSIVALGLLTLLAALLMRQGFPHGRARAAGLALLATAGIGSMGVGLSPEDVNLLVHSVSALFAFGAGSLALIALGRSSGRAPLWRSFPVYSVLSGLVGLGATVLFAVGAWGPLGPGGMERVIVAPVLLWSVLVGAALAKDARGSGRDAATRL